MKIEATRVLAIGAHTDDVELGCGGYLARLKREGAQICVAAFSRAEASLPPGAAPDALELEFRASMEVLGADQVYVGSIPVRIFDDYRQQILDELISLRRSFAPDLVLTMNSADTHQDHAVTHRESMRAFRSTTILGYESPWNQRTGAHDTFMGLDEADLERKMQMLQCYGTQAQLGRSYMDPEFVRSWAVFRGRQARLDLAEMYESLLVVSP